MYPRVGHHTNAHPLYIIHNIYTCATHGASQAGGASLPGLLCLQKTKPLRSGKGVRRPSKDPSVNLEPKRVSIQFNATQFKSSYTMQSTQFNQFNQFNSFHSSLFASLFSSSEEKKREYFARTFVFFCNFSLFSPVSFGKLGRHASAPPSFEEQQAQTNLWRCFRLHENSSFPKLTGLNRGMLV